MKNSTYAHRGAAFESFIRFANRMYARHGIAVIEKLPTEFIPLRNSYGQISGAKVEGKSKVDFIGRFRRYPIAVEAKNTNADSIRFDRVEPHQAEYMDLFTAETGTIGLVLVSFNLNRVFAIPWSFWGAAYETRVRQNDKQTRRTVNAHGQSWEIPLKFSVRADELNPEWEVDGNSGRYGLHYLEKAESYVTILGETRTNKQGE